MKGFLASAGVLLITIAAILALLFGNADFFSYSQNGTLFLLLSFFVSLLVIGFVTFRLAQKYGWRSASAALGAVFALTFLVVYSLAAMLFSAMSSSASPPASSESASAGAESAVESISAALSPSLSADVSALIANAVDQLAQGQIAFNPPNEMRAGEQYDVSARITRSLDSEATEELIAGLEEEGAVVEVETISVSSEMRVELTATEPEDFEIIALSDTQQPVGLRDFAEWEWRVRPLRGGTKTLVLKVSAIIEVPGLTQKRKSLPVMEREIDVRVNPLFSLRVFVSNYWQWLITAIVIPFLGWLWINKKGRDEEEEEDDEDDRPNVVNIHTGGGAYIAGDVSAGDDFVGRDSVEQTPKEE